MKAVVLVGGTGTRLRPLTLTVPKQVLPIVDVPMIERVLAYLEGHGVEEAVLSLGYLHGAFEALFPDRRSGNVRLTYAVEPEPLDTAGAVGFAARHAGISERFLVVNGDILTDLDVDRHGGVPRRAGGRGHDLPDRGGRPVGLRAGADRRPGPGHRLRREAGARARRDRA